MTTVKAITANINAYSEMNDFVDETDSCVKLVTTPILRYLEKVSGDAELSVKQRVRLVRLLHQVCRK
jgi:hypothetical protein